MTIDVLSVHHILGSDHSHDLDQIVSLLRSRQTPVSLVHLHHFDSLGYLPLVWRELLVGLVCNGHTVLVTTCSGFDDEALNFFSQHEILCLRRSNQGRCIGAYRDTALISFQLASMNVQFRHVLFINDSMLPLAPNSAALQDLEEVMALASGAKASALAGLTDSYEKGYHLQSFCFCANESLLLDPAWQIFWLSLDVQIPKDQLIVSGEVGLSVAMTTAGVKLLPLYPLIKRLLLNPLVPEDLACCGDYSLDRINPSLFLWRALHDEGFPFVKKILMFALPTRLGGALGVHKILYESTPPIRDMLLVDIHHVLVSRSLPAKAEAWDGISGSNPLSSPESYQPPIKDGPSEPPLRLVELRKHVSKTQLGMEIGPFHSPICPKRDGYNCLSVDILPRDQLIQAYADDQDVIPLLENVEEVDVLMTSGLLASMADYVQGEDARVKNTQSCLSYLISSHNFEHLPDPISFLDESAVLLADGGFLTMAIPVGTRCFNCFRPLSTTGQLIDAHRSALVKPSLGAIFDQSASAATYYGGRRIGDRTYQLQQITADACGGTIDAASFDALQFTHEFGHAGGIHSFVFNPYSFLLIFEDLQGCGFLPLLRITEVIDRGGQEFIVHIAKIPESSRCPLPLSAQRRTELLRLSISYYIDDLQSSSNS